MRLTCYQFAQNTKRILLVFCCLYNYEMDFDTAVKTINDLLEKEQPKTFSSSWISTRSPAVYHFVRINFRTENDHIDWDHFTHKLERKYIKRWVRYKRKVAKPYRPSRDIARSHPCHRESRFTTFAGLYPPIPEFYLRVVFSNTSTRNEQEVLSILNRALS